MKINDIYKYFSCFFSCFFSFFHLHFFSGDTLPSSSVILMEYYIPLNILILFDAVALVLSGHPCFLR